MKMKLYTTQSMESEGEAHSYFHGFFQVLCSLFSVPHLLSFPQDLCFRKNRISTFTWPLNLICKGFASQ